MAYTGPTIRVKSTTVTGSTSTASIPYPSGIQNGDMMFLLVETANETVTTPKGWVLLDLQGVGTATSNTSSRITVFYKIYHSISVISSVTLSDAGNHTIGTIFAVTPCKIHGYSKSNNSSTLAGVTFPDLTTTVDNCLLLAIGVSVTDTSGSNIDAGSFTNGFTEEFDDGDISGNGGVIYYGSKQLETAGVVGTTQCTQTSSSASARMMIALENYTIGTMSKNNESFIIN